MNAIDSPEAPESPSVATSVVCNYPLMSKTAIYGMATPFGIRLCTDYVQAGITGFQMLVTGALLAVASWALVDDVPHLLFDRLHLVSGVYTLVGMFLYMAFMRLTPLAGIHASEHMVIHTMEKGLLLTIENVRSQPRVHPRCGTNVLALFIILIGVVTVAQVSRCPVWLGVPVSAFLALLFHSKLGAWLQCHLTTRTPTDEHLRRAISTASLLSLNQMTFDLHHGWQTPADRPIKVFSHLSHLGALEVVVGNVLMSGVLQSLT